MTHEQQKMVDSKLYTRQPENEPPVRSSELVRDSEPRYSKMELIRAVNACCTCGGGGPGQKDTCPACEVYHALATVPNSGAQQPEH